MKRCSTALVFNKCKFQAEGDKTIQLIEWLKLKLIIPTVGGNVEQLECPCTAVCNPRRNSHFREQPGSFFWEAG